MKGASRTTLSQPLAALASKTASGGKIRARRFAPAWSADKPLYRFEKIRRRTQTRVGAPILANTIGNLVAEKVAGGGRSRTTGAGDAKVDQPTTGAGGGQNASSASSDSASDALPGDIVVTARRPSADISYLSYAGIGSRRMANDSVGPNPFAIPTYADGHLLSPTDIQQVGMGGGVRTKLKIDVNSPIFIGGGGEGYEVFGQDLTSEVEPYVGKRPGGGNFFTHWDDSDVMTAIQMTHDAGKPVILVGHSWGGSDAISAARWARDNQIPVDLLVTIDPVGQPNYLIWSTDTYKGIANNWVTVIADKPGIQSGDVVANAWGKTPMAVQGHANVVLHDTNAGHADFSHMMGTAHAETIISNIYRANKR